MQEEKYKNPTQEELEDLFREDEIKRPFNEFNEEDEEDFDDLDEDLEFEDVIDDKNIIFHCKPVYNFQSIEFDIEINPDDPEQMDKMFGLYAAIIKKLQEVAVDQPNQKPVAPKEPLASDKQKQIMDMYGIKYDKNTCTIKQAQELINKSINK